MAAGDGGVVVGKAGEAWNCVVCLYRCYPDERPTLEASCAVIPEDVQHRVELRRRGYRAHSLPRASLTVEGSA